MNDQFNNILAMQNTAQLNDIMQFATVAHATDIYTLNLQAGNNFKISTPDAVAKTIAFSNVPATVGLALSVSILLDYVTACAITHPAGTVWQNGIAPTFAVGKKYMLFYTSYDNGTTWMASFVGAW